MKRLNQLSFLQGVQQVVSGQGVETAAGAGHSLTVTGTLRTRRTHTSSGTHTLTWRQTSTGTYSVVCTGTLQCTVYGTILQTWQGTCLQTVKVCIWHVVTGTCLTQVSLT